jgi:hypothetical protein
LGLEAEWACYCGGEIKEKAEWATSQIGLKVEKE